MSDQPQSPDQDGTEVSELSKEGLGTTVSGDADPTTFEPEEDPEEKERK